MQSVNEELVTVNSELQSKIEQLSHTQNDVKNLFYTLFQVGREATEGWSFNELGGTRMEHQRTDTASVGGPKDR